MIFELRGISHDLLENVEGLTSVELRGRPILQHQRVPQRVEGLHIPARGLPPDVLCNGFVESHEERSAWRVSHRFDDRGGLSRAGYRLNQQISLRNLDRVEDCGLEG